MRIPVRKPGADILINCPDCDGTGGTERIGAEQVPISSRKCLGCGGTGKIKALVVKQGAPSYVK